MKILLVWADTTVRFIGSMPLKAVAYLLMRHSASLNSRIAQGTILLLCSN